MEDYCSHRLHRYSENDVAKKRYLDIKNFAIKLEIRFNFTQVNTNVKHLAQLTLTHLSTSGPSPLEKTVSNREWIAPTPEISQQVRIFRNMI